MSDSLRHCPVVPFWEDRVKNDRHVLFEGFAHGASSFIECVQDTDRDGESLLCLGLLDQAHHGLERIKQDTLTGSGHVAEQAAFDRIELGAIGRIVGHADRDLQIVDKLLEVFLEQMLVTTVTASAIAQEQDRGGVGVETPAIAVPK